MDIFQDAEANKLGKGISSLLTVKYAAVVLYRASQSVGKWFPLGASVIKQINHLLTGADLAWENEVGPGLILHHPTGVVIGPGVRAGKNLQLNQGVTIGFGSFQGDQWEAAPTLGNNMLLGAGARVIGKVRLADNIKVGANAAVVKSCDIEGATLVGVPARAL